METSLSTKKSRLQRQIPDIEQTLEMLKHLRAKKEAEQEITTDFLLTEQVYCKAKVPPTEKVREAPSHGFASKSWRRVSGLHCKGDFFCVCKTRKPKSEFWKSMKTEVF